MSGRPGNLGFHYNAAGIGYRWAVDSPFLSRRHSCGRPLQLDLVCRHCGQPVTRDTVHAEVAGD